MSLSIFFDTETTGLPKVRGVNPLKVQNIWPDLVSISWTIFDKHELIEKRTYIVKPEGWRIPEESTKFHGITHERASSIGDSLEDVLLEFKSALVDCRIIVAHNMEFDRSVVFNAYKWRLGMDPTTFWPKQEFCSMQKAKEEMKLPSASKGGYSSDPYKLPGLDELYLDTFKRSAPANAHSADRDVDVLQQIVWARWWRSDS